jgi:predicted nucleic acid-binding Zn ribbon protein
LQALRPPFWYPLKDDAIIYRDLEDTMYCSKCGKQVLGDARFCSSCGSIISQRPGPRKGLRRAVWVLWGLFFVPLLSYVVIANLIGSDGAALDEHVASLVKYALFAIGTVLLIIAFVLRWAFRKWIRSTVIRDFLIVILAGGPCIAVGIYGLILSVTNADSVSLYVLVGVAAISLLFMRPSSDVR